AELVGGNLWQLFPEAVTTEAGIQLQRAMRERVAVRYEVHSPSWQRWFIDHAYPSADGGLVILSADVTASKQSETALGVVTTGLRQPMAPAAAGLTRVDRTLRILAANPAYARIVGRPVDEVVGMRLPDVLTPDAFAKVRPYFERVLAGDRVEYEM